MNFQGSRKDMPQAAGPSGIRRYWADIGSWSARNPRLSRVVWIGVGLVLLALLIWAIYPKPQQNRRFNNGPQPVGVTAAKLGDMRVTLNALGTVTPLATATVRPQVNGVLIKLDFTEGQMVKAGDLLAEIDPRPFQASLSQAEGTLARDEATLGNDRLQLKRQQGLAAANATSQDALDTATATVRSEEGVVQTDQANVANAKINLGYARITAPVSGRAGLHLVDVGNFVSAGQATGIVVVTQLQPMSVLFTVPEDSIGPVMARVGTGASLSVDAYDRSQSVKVASGALATVDNVIDPTTGTVKLRALFDNNDEKLFPNQFVNIQLLVDTLHNQTVIPISAIQRGSDGTYVFVVGPDKVANERAVTMGVQDATMVAITKGLKPGDVVVTDGADRLRDGAEVELPNAKNQPIAAPSAPAGGDAQGARRAQAQAAMNKACGDDMKKFCAGDAPGSREQRMCLFQHRNDVSAACKAVLSRRGGGGGGRGGGGGGGGGGFGGGP